MGRPHLGRSRLYVTPCAFREFTGGGLACMSRPVLFVGGPACMSRPVLFVSSRGDAPPVCQGLGFS